MGIISEMVDWMWKIDFRIQESERRIAELQEEIEDIDSKIDERRAELRELITLREQQTYMCGKR